MKTIVRKRVAGARQNLSAVSRKSWWKNAEKKLLRLLLIKYMVDELTEEEKSYLSQKIP